MAERHRFVGESNISSGDVERLVELTESRLLQWSHSDTAYALSAFPALQEAKDSPEASAVLIGENLRGIRFGYNPNTKLWHYLRLTDHEGERHYIDDSPYLSEELRLVIDKLYANAVLDAARRDGVVAAFELRVAV